MQNCYMYSIYRANFNIPHFYCVSSFNGTFSYVTVITQLFQGKVHKTLIFPEVVPQVRAVGWEGSIAGFLG